MKFFTNKNVVQKIILALLIVILFNFAIPKPSYGISGSDLLKSLIRLLADLGDVGMDLLNKYMLGTQEMGTVMLDPKKDINLSNKDSAVYYDGNDISADDTYLEDDLSKSFWGNSTWEVPNMLYCPENIFANKIAALDVNFVHPNKYTNAYGEETNSFAKDLAPTIASWYKGFRNLAVVGLLCVLIYLGIRILLETSAQGKAKYKERLKDWFVALCLVFAMHYIMAGTLMLIERVTDLISESVNSEIHVAVKSSKDDTNSIKFKTNLTGYMRFKAQLSSWDEFVGYILIYLVLVFYTFVFTVIYLKRLLYMAFLTMIAPLVALTYPMDKFGDGNAQAFNMWFKEYLMHAILQPVHLLLYTVLVSSSMSLAKENMIYSLVAIGFMLPAEKLIKKMFRLDQGQTTSGFGSIASSALAMSALSNLAKKPPIPGKGDSGEKIGPGSATNSKPAGIRKVDRSGFESFNEDSENKKRLPNDPNNKYEEKEEKEEKNNNRLLNESNGNESKTGKFKEGMDDKWNNSSLKYKLDNTKEGMSKKWNNSSLKYNLDNTKTGERLKGAGRTAKAIGKTAVKGVSKQFKGKRFKRNLKGGLGLLARGAGIAAGGAIGVAAGIASGDVSNVFKMGSAGLMSGNAIGKNAADSIINAGESIHSGFDNFRDDYEIEKYGIVEANKKQIERQNAKARKDFLEDDSERKKYMQMAATIKNDDGKPYKVDELMNKAFDYKVAGIDDDDNIKRGLKLENKYDHEQAIDIMTVAKDYKKDDIVDDKNRSNMEKTIKSAIHDPEKQRQVMQGIADAYGLGEFYEKESASKQSSKVQTKEKVDKKTKKK